MGEILGFLRDYNVELAALTYVITIVGVPIFLYNYVSNLIQERKAKEYGTYDALDQKYTDFQKLAIEHPRLNVADFELKSPPTDLSDEEVTTQRVLFSILISLFERAHLMYRDKSSAVRRKQWTGWDSYIENYCKRQPFIDAWFNGTEPREDFSAEFDEEFEEYIRSKFRKNGLFAHKR